MQVSINLRDRTPIYIQLERGLRAAIAAGRLRAGDQLRRFGNSQAISASM